MDIQDLRIVCRLATVLNISAVGNEFKLATATISKRLRSLEEELGVQLFDRSTRSMVVTDEGLIFVEHARRMLDAFEAGCMAVEQNADVVRGRLKISAPKSVGRLDLSACISQFVAKHPEIELHVDLSSRYVNLQEENYDVTIRTGEMPDSTLIAKRIGEDPHVVVAAPSYLSKYGTPRRPQDLKKHSCLVLGDQMHWKFKRKATTQVVCARGRLSGNDASLLLNAAIEGCGVMRVSRALAAEPLADGRLKQVLKEYYNSGDSEIWAVYPATKHIPPRLRAFVDFVTSWFREHQDATTVRPAVPHVQLNHDRPLPRDVIKKGNTSRSKVGGTRAMKASQDDANGRRDATGKTGKGGKSGKKPRG